MNNVKYLGKILTSLLAVTSLIVGCSTNSSSIHTDIKPEGSKTETVTKGDITQIISLSSSMTAMPKVPIAAPSSGIISFDDGQISVGRGIKKDSLMFTINDTQYYAQYDFIVDELMVVNNSSVAKGLPVIKGTYQGFAETALLSPEAGYRILGSDVSIRAPITNGPGPFNCEPVQTSTDSNSETKNASISCLIPNDIVVYNGLSGTMAIKSKEAKNVLLLPCSAVSGSFQSGGVFAVINKEVVAKEVKLGISDGSFIEITSGLGERDIVLADPPGIGQW
ncbi:MAG: hypothetical protein LBP35_06760 [Candidatus Ancillula trichonymphae]|nr:hypothetical protein [Candidatus Ancillula trichonymphae]